MDTATLPPQLRAIADEWSKLKQEQGIQKAEIERQGGNTAELEKAFERLDDEFRGLAARIASIDTLRSMDGRDAKAFSLAKCAMAVAACRARRKEPDDADLWGAIAPYERDVIQSTARQSKQQVEWAQKTFGAPRDPSQLYRDMVSTVDSQGAILIPTPAAQNHLEYLRAYLPLIALGARVRSDMVGLKVPINTGSTSGVTTHWVGENVAPGKSDLAFSINYVTPHRLAARTIISNLLIRNSLGEVKARVEEDMPRAMAEAFQTAALFGTGASNEPKGLELWLSDGGYQETLGADANTGGRFTWRTIAKAVRILMDRKVPIDPATTAFLIAPIVEELLLTEGIEMFNAQGVDNGMLQSPAYLSWLESMGKRRRYEISQIVPTDRTKGTATALTPVIYGVWRFLNLCQWGGYRMRASDVASDGTNHMFVEDSTMLIIESEFDSLPSRPEAFVEFTDVITSV